MDTYLHISLFSVLVIFLIFKFIYNRAIDYSQETICWW